MLTNYWKFQHRSVQTYGFVYHDTNGQNHGPAWKTQSFFLKGICMVILRQEYNGKGNLRKSYWNMAGRKFQIGNVSLYIIKRIILICVCGWHKIGWKETKSWSDVEITQQRSWFGEPTSFLGHVYLVCTQRHCQVSRDVMDNYRTMFESRISAGGVEKLPFPQNLRISSWSYNMAGYAKKCVERYCELANKQLYKVSTPCIDDHHFKEEETKICWRIVTCMLSNCSEMLTLGTYWTTWYSMVSEQACTINHKMDQGLWQTH